MTTWKEDLAEAVDDLFEEAGEAAIYNGRPILVVEQGLGETTIGSPGAVISTRSIQVRASEVAAPKAGDKVVYGGVTYYVEANPLASGGVWYLGLNREIVSL